MAAAARKPPAFRVILSAIRGPRNANSKGMTTTKLIALAAIPVLLLGGCVTTTTRSTTWGEPYGSSWARYGHVESIRETVRTQQGDPAAGAVAGAIIGGLIGSSVGSHGHVDRRGRVRTHGSGVGAVAGAIGGAMIGAAASEGRAEERVYEVFVRFDDGALEPFVYHGVLPFHVSEPVVLTAQGLGRR
jgi:outer membrane lipoprotein SlyB